MLLVSGLAVIGWEVVVESSERPTIIIAALLMMGISVPLHLDAVAKNALEALKSKEALEAALREKEDTPMSEDKS